MNILLPTDFSANSRNAAAYAFQYFAGVACTFYFLHVSPATLEKAENSLSIPLKIQHKFNELFQYPELLKQGPNHSFQTLYKEDYFIEAVRDIVLEKKIDLIIMGTKGITNNKMNVIGKNTSDVITKVKCPALAITENAVFKSNHQILFPTDYKIQYSAKMLHTLFTLSQLSRASVKILEFYKTDKEPSPEQINNREILHNSFPTVSPAVQTFYSTNNSDCSSLFSTNENSDMIVMAAKNINLCQRLLKNNTKDQIFCINKLPMLVLHG